MKASTSDQHKVVVLLPREKKTSGSWGQSSSLLDSFLFWHDLLLEDVIFGVDRLLFFTWLPERNEVTWISVTSRRNEQTEKRDRKHREWWQNKETWGDRERIKKRKTIECHMRDSLVTLLVFHDKKETRERRLEVARNYSGGSVFDSLTTTVADKEENQEENDKE